MEYFCTSHDPNDPKNLVAHHDVIVNSPQASQEHEEKMKANMQPAETTRHFEIPVTGHPGSQAQTSQPETTASTCAPSTMPAQTNQHPNNNTSGPCEEMTPNVHCTSDTFGEVSEQDLNETTAPPYMPGTQHKRVKGSKGKLNLCLFEGLVPTSVDKMPWDPNGNAIYLIPAIEEYWHDKQVDGRHWIFTTSSKKGLNGIRKFGTCQSSLICMSPECQTWTTEKVHNQVDFKAEEYGTYSCNCCTLVAHNFCSTYKVTEFNKRTNLMTVWHQGNHNCNLQPNVNHQDKILQEESCKRPPINIQLRNTTHEFQIDLIGYYILISDQEKAIELAEDLADKNLVQKLQNKPTNDVLGEFKYGYGNLMDKFKNVGKLKATADKEDEFHIYKMNCSAMNGEPCF